MIGAPDFTLISRARCCFLEIRGNSTQTLQGLIRGVPEGAGNARGKLAVSLSPVFPFSP